MNFFNKLFGSKQEVKIRAQYKNLKYFEKHLEKFVEIRLNDLNEIINSNKADPYHFGAKASILYIKIMMYYSMNKSIEELLPLYNDAFDNFLKSWDKVSPIYVSMLNMISMAILLDIPEEKMQLLAYFVKRMEDETTEKIWKTDALLWFLLKGKKNESDDLIFPKQYKKLYKITDILDKKKAGIVIDQYLVKWYEHNKIEPWYNSHLRGSFYHGYWAFEVAALTKVMGLNDYEFKDNIYYPYDLVHWKDN